MKISTASDDVERAAMADKPYLSLMGSLLWAQVTHPETAYYTNFLCQFMHDPSIAAWDAGLAILAYLAPLGAAKRGQAVRAVLQRGPIYTHIHIS